MNDLEPDLVLGVQRGSPEAARCRWATARVIPFDVPDDRTADEQGCALHVEVGGRVHHRPDDGHDHGLGVNAVQQHHWLCADSAWTRGHTAVDGPSATVFHELIAIVVRGDDLDPATARHQALLFRRRYPDWERWGLSAYYARSPAEIDDLGADQLERFPQLLVYSVAALLAVGIEVVPTFRTPHVTLAFTGDLDDGLAGLERADPERRTNPCHVP